jgi:large subunit ribosomal protein L4
MSASVNSVEVTGPIKVPVVNRKGDALDPIEIDPKDFGGKISKQLMHDVVLMQLANKRAGTHSTLRRGEVAGSTKKLFRQKGTGNARVGTKRTNKRRGGGTVNRQLLHDVVLMHLANQRAGTHSTLRRGEVAGSTKKIFRQKGTGNARAGTKRTNKRRGGGTSKGPKPRDYSYSIPKKAVRAATRMAILSKFIDKEAVILDDLAISTPKTKEIVGVLKAIKVGKKTTEKGERDVTLHDTTVLIGTAGLDQNVYKSARNIEGVKVLPAAEFNCFTVLKQRRLLLTKAALEFLKNPEEARAKAAAK